MSKNIITPKNILGVTLSSLIFLSGCSAASAPSASSDTPVTTEKSGTTTKSGKITKAGAKYFLTENGKQPQEIDSYSVDLSTQVGKTVKVTGQYSGDTLFVDQAE